MINYRPAIYIYETPQKTILAQTYIAFNYSLAEANSILDISSTSIYCFCKGYKQTCETKD